MRTYKTIICPVCDNEYYSLGYARHRAAHHERKIGEIKKPMPKYKSRLLTQNNNLTQIFFHEKYFTPNFSKFFFAYNLK